MPLCVGGGSRPVRNLPRVGPGSATGASDAAAPPGMMPTDGNPTAEHAAARARILIVEDDALNRLLVHDLLELRGHEVRRGGDRGRGAARARRRAAGSAAARRADPGRRRRGGDPPRARARRARRRCRSWRSPRWRCPAIASACWGAAFRATCRSRSTPARSAPSSSRFSAAPPARRIASVSVTAGLRGQRRRPPSWWSTTTSRTGRWRRGTWSAPATPSSRPRGAPRRWRCWRRGGPTWCCSTCSCRGWTATRPAGASARCPRSATCRCCS